MTIMRVVIVVMSDVFRGLRVEQMSGFFFIWSD